MRVRPAAGQRPRTGRDKDGDIRLLPRHLVAMKGIQLSQVHPKDEHQETARLVSAAKLGFCKYVSGLTTVNRNTLVGSCMFIWSGLSRRTVSVCKYVYKCTYWI